MNWVKWLGLIVRETIVGVAAWVVEAVWRKPSRDIAARHFNNKIMVFNCVPVYKARKAPRPTGLNLVGHGSHRLGYPYMASISDVLPFLEDSHKFVLVTGAGLRASAFLVLLSIIALAISSADFIIPFANFSPDFSAAFTMPSAITLTSESLILFIWMQIYKSFAHERKIWAPYNET